jgi:hypothetical protein
MFRYDTEVEARAVEVTDRKIHWRCFHCGDTFTKAQEKWARQHFGVEHDDPSTEGRG